MAFNSRCLPNLYPHSVPWILVTLLSNLSQIGLLNVGMTRIISLFNHKGGVSKTTTTFNLGWALAEQEKRVLIVDGDPQCNLTGTVLGFNGDDDFEDFYTNNPGGNLVGGLTSVFQGTQIPLSPGSVVNTKDLGKNNLNIQGLGEMV
jgi:hypothetical protein